MDSIPYDEHVCLNCGRRFFDELHHNDDPICSDCYNDLIDQYDYDDEYARSEAAYQEWRYYGEEGYE